MRNQDKFSKSVRRFVVAFYGLLAVTFLAVACGTVAPKPIETKEPSLDGNAANSGVIGIAPDGVSSVVTAHWRDRYNAMIDTYGKYLGLKADDGLTRMGANWVVDRQHHGYFEDMNAWRKAGFTVPPGK